MQGPGHLCVGFLLKLEATYGAIISFCLSGRYVDCFRTKAKFVVITTSESESICGHAPARLFYLPFQRRPTVLFLYVSPIR